MSFLTLMTRACVIFATFYSPGCWSPKEIFIVNHSFIPLRITAASHPEEIDVELGQSTINPKDESANNNNNNNNNNNKNNPVTSQVSESDAFDLETGTSSLATSNLKRKSSLSDAVRTIKKVHDKKSSRDEILKKVYKTEELNFESR